MKIEPMENDKLLAQEAEVLRLSHLAGQMILRIRGLRAQGANPGVSLEARRLCIQSADADQEVLDKHIEIHRQAELKLHELRKNCINVSDH
jgi:hypothetical protein